MTNMLKGKILKTSAITVDVAVPFIATLTQFPVWVEKSSEATVSGLFLIFAFISCLPFYRQIKNYLRSPSVWVLWCVMFVFFILLRNIIDEMVIVCFFGTLSNVVGNGVYKLGEHFENKEKGKKIEVEESEDIT